jgi:hypothetical protein
MSLSDDLYDSLHKIEDILADASRKIDELESLLFRARVILRNMSREEKSCWFRRWSISDEPLRHDAIRHDAKRLIPEIDAALEEDGQEENGQEENES